jgi:hypothetical protein
MRPQKASHYRSVNGPQLILKHPDGRMQQKSCQQWLRATPINPEVISPRILRSKTMQNCCERRNELKPLRLL